MKRIISLVLIVLFFFSCTGKNTASSNGKKEQEKNTILKIGAVRDFKQSKEGAALVFDTLMKITPDYRPLPHIITEWNRNDTATEYAITVRTDILFSDGTPLTAKIVKYAIEKAAPMMWCGFSYLLKEVIMTDAEHLKITLTAPYYFLPHDLALVPVIKENGIDEAMNITDFTGTGAYILTEYKDGQSASLVKNEAYWNKEFHSAISAIEWIVITDDNTRDLALSSGQIDVLGISEHYLSIQYPSIHDLTKIKKMSFIAEPSESFTSLISIGFNWKEGFCSDVALRKALEYGINRKEIVETLYFGIPEVCGHQFNPAFTDGPQQEKPYYYDLDLAKQIITQAGYTDTDGDGFIEKDGKKVSLRFLISSKEDYQRDLAVFVQSELKKLGIDCKIISAAGEVLKEHFKTGNYDLAVQHPWYEPIIGAVTYFGFDNQYTEYGLSYAVNKKSVEAAQALIESKTEEEIKMHAGALWKEQYEHCVTLPICTSSRVAIFNPQFEGFKFNGNVYLIDLSGVKRK